MTAWNKAAVLEWFRAHAGRRVMLRQPSTLLQVTGTVRSVQELDACSADFHAVDFECGLEGVQVSLSFHDDTLSLHLLATPLHREEATLSLPFSIPYSDLELSLAEAERKREHTDSGPSPYELLR
jgi:hypothetical protein